jgi:hypothetical protein
MRLEGQSQYTAPNEACSLQRDSYGGHHNTHASSNAAVGIVIVTGRSRRLAAKDHRENLREQVQRNEIRGVRKNESEETNVFNLPAP